MSAGPWIPTNTTLQKILNDTFNLTTDTFKCAVLASSSNISPTSTAFSGVTGELSTAGGYTAGGASVAFTVALVSTNDAVVEFTSNPSWTATATLTGRFFAIYEVGGDVAFYCLGDNTPADFTVASGQVLSVDSDGTPTPVMTFAV